MAETGEARGDAYRCPVCGHRDLAELPAGATEGIIRCSHCETALKAELRDDDTGRLAVRVAEEAES